MLPSGRARLRTHFLNTPVNLSNGNMLCRNTGPSSGLRFWSKRHNATQILLGPTLRLQPAHAAPPARAPPSAQREGGLLRRQGLQPNASQPAHPLRPNAMAACFGAKFASSQTEPSEQQVLQTQKCLGLSVGVRSQVLSFRGSEAVLLLHVSSTLQ